VASKITDLEAEDAKPKCWKERRNSTQKKDSQMSWVKDCLQQERASVSNSERPREVLAQNVPVWNEVWHIIHDVILADVLEFNNNSSRQFDVSSDPEFIQMIPKQPPLDTVVLQIDPHTGVMQLTCPISHPGVPRRGHFKIEQGCIVSLGNSVGQPQPPDEPMKPEQFSEFVLKPLLFP
jgi:hypothetical protein